MADPKTTEKRGLRCQMANISYKLEVDDEWNSINPSKNKSSN